MLLLAPAMFMLLFILGAKLKAGPVVRSVSKYSFGIYLLHFFFIALIYKVSGSALEHVPAFLAACFLFASSVVLSAIATWITQRVPFGDYIVGPVGRTPRV